MDRKSPISRRFDVDGDSSLNWRHPSDPTLRKWVVTLKDRSEVSGFYVDMETPGGSVTIPNRKCDCCSRRPASRSTYYWLTQEERDDLINDSRVAAIELTAEERGAYKDVWHWTQTSTKFSKDCVNSADDINWGLVRSLQTTNPSNWGDDGTNQNYDLSRTISSELSGRNVDVCIMDDGTPTPSTLEYAQNSDGTGWSRMIQYDWHGGAIYNFTSSLDSGNETDANRTAGTYDPVYATGGSGTGCGFFVLVQSDGYTSVYISNLKENDPDDPAGSPRFQGGRGYKPGDVLTISDAQIGGGGGANITITVNSNSATLEGVPDYQYNAVAKHEHGAHCTGTVAGNTQGWARDSDIYNYIFYDDPHYVLNLHQLKEVNPLTGVKNPTIMNNSWGFRKEAFDSYCKYTGKIRYRSTDILPLTNGSMIPWLATTATTAGDMGWTWTDSAGARTNGTYNNVSVTTNGSGTGCKVNVTVSNGNVEKISSTGNDSDLGSGYSFGVLTAFTWQYSGANTTASTSDLVAGTYNNVTAYSYWAQNSNYAKFNVVVASDKTVTLTIADGGLNNQLSLTPIPGAELWIYANDLGGGLWGGSHLVITPTACTSDTITIPSASIGGGSDLTIAQSGLRCSGDPKFGAAAWTESKLKAAGMGTGSIPVRDAETDADFEDILDGGVIAVVSAGNSDFYQDVEGGLDYDNYYEYWDESYTGRLVGHTHDRSTHTSTTTYYHRGSSPGAAGSGRADGGVICVGAMGDHNDGGSYPTSFGAMVSVYSTTGLNMVDYKAEFSNYGPRIDVWAAGAGVNSSYKTSGQSYGTTGHPDISAKDDPRLTTLGLDFAESTSDAFIKFPGTSMSGPQVCGVLACLAERHPLMTITDAKNYIKDFCEETIETTNGGLREDDKDLGRNYNAASCKAHLYLKNIRKTDTGGLSYPEMGSISRSSVSGQKFPRRVNSFRNMGSPTFALSTSSTTLAKGTPATITLTTTNVPDGTKVPYIISSKHRGAGLLLDYYHTNKGTWLVSDSTQAYQAEVFDPYHGLDFGGYKIEDRHAHKINMSAAATTPTVERVEMARSLGPSDTNVYLFKDLNTPFDGGNADNGFWEIDLPWNVPIFGTNKTKLYYNSNHYITFGAGVTVDHEYGAIPQDRICLGSFPALSAWNIGTKTYSNSTAHGGAATDRFCVWFTSHVNQVVECTELSFFANDLDHIYVHTWNHTHSWTEFYSGYMWDQGEDYFGAPLTGSFAVNNNTASITLDPKFGNQLAHTLNVRVNSFGAANIDLNHIDVSTYEVTVNAYNQSGNGQRPSTYKVTGSHRGQFGATSVYTSSTDVHTLHYRVGDKVVFDNQSGSNIMISDYPGGSEHSDVSSNTQSAYTWTPSASGIYYLWNSTQTSNSIRDGDLRLYVYGKYDVTIVSGNTTNGYKTKGIDRADYFDETDDKTIYLQPGDELVFNNTASGAHPVRISRTPNGPEHGWVSDNTQSSYTFRPLTIGTWYYYCTNHTGMDGKIVVGCFDDSSFSDNTISASTTTGGYIMTANDRKDWYVDKTSPTLEYRLGDKIKFNNSASGSHPFYITASPETAQTLNLNVSVSSSKYVFDGADRSSGRGSKYHRQAVQSKIRVRIGDTINFAVSTTGHPFHIKTQQTTGTGNQVSGVTNNGATSGTITWNTTGETAGVYYYQCEYHTNMTGMIELYDTVQDMHSAGGCADIYSNYQSNYWFMPSFPGTYYYHCENHAAMTGTINVKSG